MKMTPWAKLTMRMMPKISVSPQAMKKRIDACESALRHCARMKPNQFIGLLVSQTRMGWCGDKDCRTGDWLDLLPLPVEVGYIRLRLLSKCRTRVNPSSDGGGGAA